MRTAISVYTLVLTLIMLSCKPHFSFRLKAFKALANHSIIIPVRKTWNGFEVAPNLNGLFTFSFYTYLRGRFTEMSSINVNSVDLGNNSKWSTMRTKVPNNNWATLSERVQLDCMRTIGMWTQCHINSLISPFE